MKPFNDDTMNYDKEEHRYVLTEAYVEDKTGVKLSQVLNPAFTSHPEKLGEQFLDEISDEIYTWIYEHNADNDIQEYFLATDEDLRIMLRKAMLKQVIFVMKSGDLFYYCGVNLKNGVVIDGNKIVENALSPLSKRILAKQVKALGTSVIYQGKFRYPYMMMNKGDY